MVNIEELHVGDKVRIVSEWNPDCHQSRYGSMDKYLGKIVTIKNICLKPTMSFPVHVRIEEDDGLWSWVGAAIECVIADDCPDFDIEDKDKFLAFLKT